MQQLIVPWVFRQHLGFVSAHPCCVAASLFSDYLFVHIADEPFAVLPQQLVQPRQRWLCPVLGAHEVLWALLPPPIPRRSLLPAGVPPALLFICSVLGLPSGTFFLLLRALFTPAALNKALLPFQLKAAALQVFLSLLLEPALTHG